MKLTLACLALSAALLLAACGGGNDNGDATASSGSTTVSLSDGLLVDSTGAALYTSEQEKSGKVACTAGCTSIWLPLTSSGQPTAGDGVSGRLGTVKRPDGSRQVTLDGRPLYRFAQDSESGKATGDGVTDNFDGRQFTWHAEGTGMSSSSEDGGGGGSNYSY